jgi:hypothetical protein
MNIYDCIPDGIMVQRYPLEIKISHCDTAASLRYIQMANAVVATKASPSQTHTYGNANTSQQIGKVFFKVS